MNSIEDQILSFTAQHLGVKKQKVSLSSCLSRDLGMDGDDAVEFLDAFGKTFGVDLDLLHIHRGQHFAPEGGPGVSFVVGCSVCFVIGWVIHRMVGVVPWWGWGLGLAVIWMWPLRCWPFHSPQTLSVTTQDLVDAAKRKGGKQYDLTA